MADKILSVLGNDANSGDSTISPWKTFNHAWPRLNPGDRLLIRGGTIGQWIDVNLQGVIGGNDWNTPITIAAFEGEPVTILPNKQDGINLAGENTQYLIFDGLDLNGVNTDKMVSGTNGAHHIRFIRCKIRDASRHGILAGVGQPAITKSTYWELIDNEVFGNGASHLDHGFYFETSDNVFDGNHIHHNASFGVHLFVSALPGVRVNNNMVKRNIIHENSVHSASAAGILLSSGDNNQAIQNIIYDNQTGIDIHNNSPTNSRALHNTIVNCHEGLKISNLSTDAEVKNNLVNGGAFPFVNDGVNTDLGGNFISGDPLFLDAQAHNYRLEPLSPALNYGVVVVGVDFDYDGNIRPNGPAPDAGAFEIPSSVSITFDDFNRANETPLASPYAVSRGVGFNLVNGQAVSGNSNGVGATNTSIQPATQEISIRVGPNNTATLILQLNVQVPSNWQSDHVQVDFKNNDTVEIWTQVNGAWNQLGTPVTLSPGLATGDTLRFKHDAAAHTLEAWRNGALIRSESVTIVELPGYTGVASAPGGIAQFDDWSVGPDSRVLVEQAMPLESQKFVIATQVLLLERGSIAPVTDPEEQDREQFATLFQVTVEDYRSQILSVLPPGPAWSRESDSVLVQMLHGFADSLTRLHNRALELVQESDPRTTQELLLDFERVAGLPEEGVDQPSIDTDRRDALVEKLTRVGRQDCAYFIEVAKKLGYTIAIREFKPFTVGSSSGDEIYGDEWQFVWEVQSPQETITFELVSGASSGDPLRSWGNSLLEQVLNKLKPAHTTILFTYGG